MLCIRHDAAIKIAAKTDTPRLVSVSSNLKRKKSSKYPFSLSLPRRQGPALSDPTFYLELHTRGLVAIGLVSEKVLQAARPQLLPACLSDMEEVSDVVATGCTRPIRNIKPDLVTSGDDFIADVGNK